jgi:hypothetical protein
MPEGVEELWESFIILSDYRDISPAGIAPIPLETLQLFNDQQLKGWGWQEFLLLMRLDKKVRSIVNGNAPPTPAKPSNPNAPPEPVSVHNSEGLKTLFRSFKGRRPASKE